MIASTPTRRAAGKKVKVERNRLNLDGVEHRDKHFANPS
jgi:hypothetical protein